MNEGTKRRVSEQLIQIKRLASIFIRVCHSLIFSPPLYFLNEQQLEIFKSFEWNKDKNSSSLV